MSGEDEEEDTRPGSKFGHFQRVIKTEPKRISACG